MVRRSLFFLVCFLSLGLGGCVKSFTVHFANACDVPVNIATYETPPDRVSEEHLLFEGKVEALASLKVEDAFLEDPGSVSTLEIRDTSKLIPVNASLLDDQDAEEPIVVIPADACP